MKQLIKLQILSLFFLMTYGCVTYQKASSDAPPQWLSDKNSTYPEAQYLAEIGEGDNLRDAKANAASSIAQVFSTRIQTDSTIQTLYSELTNANKIPLSISQETNINQNITQSADESLINLRYGDSWTNKMGRVYVIAYLNRLETGNLYRQRIIEKQNRVTELLQRTATLNAPLRRFSIANAAYVHSLTAENLLKQLEIINTALARASRPSYNPDTVRQYRKDSATALKVLIKTSGENNDTLNATLSDWISMQGFTLATGNDANLSIVASVTITPLKMNNKYKNLSWQLRLALKDNLERQAFSLSSEGRSSGISESAAKTRTATDISRSLKKNLNQEFHSYLLSFVQ